MLPQWISHLDVGRMKIGGETISIAIQGDAVEVHGAGQLEVVHRPRSPITAILD